MGTMTEFAPSAYQQKIFEAVVNMQTRNNKALVISAVPGSGKTTTMKEIIRYLPTDASVLALAFNVDAANQLKKKIHQVVKSMDLAPNVTCSTIHSLGNSTLTTAQLKSTPKNGKYLMLCKDYIAGQPKVDPALAYPLAKLVDMVRLCLSPVGSEDLIALCDRFEIDIDSDDEDIWAVVLDAVPSVLNAGMALCKEQRVIDFADMIWLPEVLELQPQRYDYVLVDEAQDLNPAQRNLVLKAKKHDGALIAVGDRNQSIYGFSGASLYSIDEIIEATNAQELPLGICYRCPQSVIGLAASVYPGIEASPDAPMGLVKRISQDQVSSLVRPGDLILSRMTAPLVAECLRLLRQKMPANVRGRDLGTSFLSLIKKVEKFAHGRLSVETMTEWLRKYTTKQMEILSLNPDENEQKIITLQDKVETLTVLYEAFLEQDPRDSRMDDFIGFIKNFFQENKQAQIILSTGHRAKGLEYPRVFILGADRLPHKRATKPEAIKQEHNLMYVMYTRVLYSTEHPDSGTLYLVNSTKDEEPPKGEKTHMPVLPQTPIEILLDTDLIQSLHGQDLSKLLNSLLRDHIGETHPF